MERVIYLLSLSVIVFLNKKAQESMFYFFVSLLHITLGSDR